MSLSKKVVAYAIPFIFTLCLSGLFFMYVPNTQAQDCSGLSDQDLTNCENNGSGPAAPTGGTSNAGAGRGVVNPAPATSPTPTTPNAGVSGYHDPVYDAPATSVQNPVGSGQNPVGSGQNPGTPGKLNNPLGQDDIGAFLLNIVDIIAVFLTPIVILFIMYAGYLFVTARGQSEKIETARSALLWAVVGGVIVLGARAIVTVIEGTAKAL